MCLVITFFVSLNKLNVDFNNISYQLIHIIYFQKEKESKRAREQERKREREQESKRAREKESKREREQEIKREREKESKEQE